MPTIANKIQVSNAVSVPAKMQPQRVQTDLTSIITEDITPEFGKLSYLGFSLIIKRANGYINATHLCAQSEKKRELFNWTPLKTTKEVMEDLSTTLGLPSSDLTQTVAGGQITEIRGTYVHPMLVPVIAQWASPRFRTRVAIILENEAVRDYKKQVADLNDINFRLEKKIDALTLKNDEQTRKMDEQTAQIAELLGYSKNTNEKLDDIKTSVRNIEENTVVVETKIDEIREVVSEHVVAPAPKTPSKQHGYVVMQVDGLTYKTVRRQISGLKTACAKLIKEHPGARVVFEAKPCANAVSLNTRIAEALRDNAHVRMRYQTIEITDPEHFHEDDLVAIFKDVYEKCAEHVEKIEDIKTKLDTISKIIVDTES